MDDKTVISFAIKLIRNKSSIRDVQLRFTYKTDSVTHEASNFSFAKHFSYKIEYITTIEA